MNIGCDTAKSVLRLSVEDIERRTDLERETIEEVMAILQNEFEDWPFDKIVRLNNQAKVLMSNEPLMLRKPEFPVVKNEVYFDILKILI